MLTVALPNTFVRPVPVPEGYRYGNGPREIAHRERTETDLRPRRAKPARRETTADTGVSPGRTEGRPCAASEFQPILSRWQGTQRREMSVELQRRTPRAVATAWDSTSSGEKKVSQGNRKEKQTEPTGGRQEEG